MNKSHVIRLKIVEHFGTAEEFAVALRKDGLRIDSCAVSRIKNGFKKPTVQQRQAFAKMLKTPEAELFDI